MNAEPRDLAALISSRICHDLINPIGAISNGLELLETIGKGFGPELGLVADSVANASAKINYFRIAFGDSMADSELRAAVIQKTVADMFKMTRLDIEVEIDAHATPRPDAKLLLLVLLCIDASLPLGGKMHVTRDGGAWRISATATRTKPAVEFWEMLSSGVEIAGIGSAEVQFAVACQTARECGLTIEHQFSEAGCEVTIRR